MKGSISRVRFPVLSDRGRKDDCCADFEFDQSNIARSKDFLTSKLAFLTNAKQKCRFEDY